MIIDVLTLFPDFYQSYLDTSITKRALANGVVKINVYNFRDYSDEKNKRVDDYTCGGGAGLIIKPQPVLDCLRSIKTKESLVILLSPRGEQFKQKKARELALAKHLVLICGHYEGIDERIMKEVDLVLSIGDYILTGGEIASLVVMDAIIRLLDGTINELSHLDESFENGLLEYPQYTLPRVYEDEKIPDILFSGNHKAINKWRLKESLKITLKNRPDLLVNRRLSKLEKELLAEINNKIEEPEWLIKAIEDAKKFM